MPLTIHKALDLKALERFKLVAGINGLNNKITRVGLIDHETPDLIRQMVIPGEFLFSNMLQIKGRPEELLNYVKTMVECQASCFALKTIYFQSFPQEVIDYANANKFPLFTFDVTYIENIIIDIDQAMHAQGQMAKKIGLIDALVENESDPLKTRSTALKLNRSFNNRFLIASIDILETSEQHTVSLNMIENTLQQLLGKSATVLEYDGSLLIIATFSKALTNDPDSATMSAFIQDALSSCGLMSIDYRMGLSQYKESLGDMGRAVLESRYALEYCYIQNSFLTEFRELGIYQILLPNLDNPWFNSHYESFVRTLISYDEKHDTDLLETAVAYIECDANVKATAEKLYQHVNTVRYRIKKIWELLNLHALSGMQYETLAMAIHLYKLQAR